MFKEFHRLVHLAFGGTGILFCLAAAAGEKPIEARANQMIEWSFTSQKNYADPFNDIELDVVVTAPGGQRLRVPAFWAGEQTWRVRYASPQIGVHRYQTECSDQQNDSLNGRVGEIEVKPYQRSNRFYRHGPLRVAGDKSHFEHADGTPFLWLADTWWMGLCQRLKWPDDFKALTADRAEKGFNVVQIVAGLYPDMPAFDQRGANESGFPWTRDYGRINPEYFDAADRRLAWLVENGIAPCLVGSWGYHIPWLGAERMKKHWRYLVARYGAYPMFWCIAGEGTMPFYLSKTPKEDSAFQRKVLTEIAAYVRKIDPYHHPISIHPAETSRDQVEDVSLLDFDMLQTGHGDRASIPNTIRLVRASRSAQPPMPTVNSEVCFEGIMGTCFEDIQRFMIWSCLLSGDAGHTYGGNGVWQVNRRGEPYGKSPAGNNWGETPWDEAARLPGSRQSGLAKKLLEQYPWWQFAPHPEWASFEEPHESSHWGQWIWYPEGAPAKDAPAGECLFRRAIEISRSEKVSWANLRLAADNRAEVCINGKKIGVHLGWNPHWEFNVTSLLKPGANVLAIRAENLPAPSGPNPAGLIVSLNILFESGRKLEVLSDKDWRCSRQETAGWRERDFDDSAWPKALKVGDNGDPPWGELGGSDPYMIPYAAGIPGRVRLIYAPLPRPLNLRGLESGAKYKATYFNPREGTKSNAQITRQNSESAKVANPRVDSPDWVLMLEAQ